MPGVIYLGTVQPVPRGYQERITGTSIVFTILQLLAYITPKVHEYIHMSLE